MSNLLETIKIEDGKIYNLSYHQDRLDNSQKDIFDNYQSINLNSIIKPPSKGLYRCRVVYNIELIKIEYILYRPKKIESIKIIDSDIDYKYKYENREDLNSLLDINFDEVIIVKDNLITDTTISNIALFDGDSWITPKTPLLKGTQRAKLIDKKFLKEKNIRVDELKNYQNIAIINAMIGFKILDIKPKEII